jgi:hypothetical protein
MKNGCKTNRADDFITPARRALRRAARKVRQENRRLGLPVLDWQDGKVLKKFVSPVHICKRPMPEEDSAHARPDPA